MSETVFTYAAPALKFGSGAVDEIGHDVAGLGGRHVLVVTDPGLAATGHPERVAEYERLYQRYLAWGAAAEPLYNRGVPA